MNAPSSTSPWLSATRIEMMSASGHTWRMIPAMNVPWPDELSSAPVERPGEVAVELGIGAPVGERR